MAKRKSPKSPKKVIRKHPRSSPKANARMEDFLIQNGVLVPQEGGHYSIRLDERIVDVTSLGRQVIRLIKHLMSEAKQK